LLLSTRQSISGCPKDSSNNILREYITEDNVILAVNQLRKADIYDEYEMLQLTNDYREWVKGELVSLETEAELEPFEDYYAQFIKEL